ncbi:unnamed protein product [Phaedon cochleariae]|uniref:LysM domain-containing protein n=1 Tax=Phaedon cochleariae TaxID=80249 RepID=A0A9P0GM60_PHACE|nr:unnamed protein product [Phaedon cochleariae]
MIKQRQKYKRLEKGKDSDSDDGEETELFVRKQSPKKEPTVDRAVEVNDTLQSLAITYNCSIADLKRLNNIHNENEIFARRTIKVPYRPFTLALADVHISGDHSPESVGEPSTSQLIDIESLNTKLSDSLPRNESRNLEVNDIIFNSQISQKSNNVNTEQECTGNCEEQEVSLLPQVDVPLQKADLTASRLSCNGADADISWIALILCIVIVIFAIPLIYVFYIAEHPDQYHHHNS